MILRYCCNRLPVQYVTVVQQDGGQFDCHLAMQIRVCFTTGLEQVCCQ